MRSTARDPAPLMFAEPLYDRVAMNGSTELEIAPAQGRPMLSWVGKRLLPTIRVPPAQLVETYCRLADDQRHDEPVPLIMRGENKEALAWLLANGFRGQVKLVYIDPPFDSGTDIGRKVSLRGTSTAPDANVRLAVQKRARALGKQAQYSDNWVADEYLQFMYERLLLLRELLSEQGSIWLHCDYRRVHYLHLLLEEVFGTDNYLNTISWRSQTARGAKVNAFYFPFSTQYIDIFARNRTAPTTWNLIRKQSILREAEAAAEFMRDARGFFRTSDPGSYSFESLKALHTEGRLYAPYGGEIVVDEAARRIYASNGGNIGVKYYLKRLGNHRYAVERAIDNLWDDIPGLGTTPGEDLGYPTQKTEALLRRIIAVSTHPGDLVLDCFAGSGTTAAVAQKMGRRWIVCDANRAAIQTTIRRMQAVMPRQLTTQQMTLDGTVVDTVVDTVVQADRGRKRRKIKRHPHGERQVATNQFAVYQVGSAGLDAPPSEPARAQMTAERYVNGAQTVIRIRIVEYESPAMAARVSGAERRAPPDDWRTMVDSVMIDPAYDGKALNFVFSDVPQKRTELVSGSYEFPAPPAPTVVAVKVTDVLGEEVLVTQVV
jgi:adenine-specific DNA-methyltransferase